MSKTMIVTCSTDGGVKALIGSQYAHLDPDQAEAFREHLGLGVQDFQPADQRWQLRLYVNQPEFKPEEPVFKMAAYAASVNFSLCCLFKLVHLGDKGTKLRFEKDEVGACKEAISKLGFDWNLLLNRLAERTPHRVNRYGTLRDGNIDRSSDDLLAKPPDVWREWPGWWFKARRIPQEKP
jgi:hypothetical protein